MQINRSMSLVFIFQKAMKEQQIDLGDVVKNHLNTPEECKPPS